MSSLPSIIEALLAKAQADAAAALRDFGGAAGLYEKARGLDAKSVEGEQLARLYFLSENWDALSVLLPSLEEGRRVIWHAVLSARRGSKVDFPTPAYEADFDSVYRAYLMSIQDQPAEARTHWMEYLRTVQESWERGFVGRALLNLEPAQCCGCQEKPAVDYLHDRPVCSPCRAFVEGPDFIEAMKGKDPEKVRLIENLSGEPFEPQDISDMAQSNKPPNWRPGPEEPILELPDVPPLIEFLDAEATASWNRARRFAQESGVLEPCHLWRALLELPDSAYDVLSREDLLVIREAIPKELDLRWVLNLARWGAGLFPFRESPMVSPLDLLLALTWTLPSKMRSLAVLRARVSEQGCSDRQRGEFERLIKERPHDLYLRVMVSGRPDGVEPPVLLERMLWFISHHPEHIEHCGLSPGLCRPDVQQKIVEAWCEAVRTQPSRVGVLTGAADFFAYEQPQLRLELYRRAAELEPNGFGHPFSVADSYRRLAELAKHGEKAEGFLREAVVWMERALEHVSDPEERCELLYDALGFAFDGKAWKKVASLAKELQATSGDEKRPDEFWTHKVEMALGHVALESGDLLSARRHLVDSVGGQCQPGDDAFAPSMGLAKKLLDLGEQTVVLEYFALCAKFWKCGTAFLGEWTAQVRAGEVPDFPPPGEILNSTFGYRNFDDVEL